MIPASIDTSEGRYVILIPAYNEVGTIRDVVSRALCHGLSVIVVDDGSTDGTTEALDGLPVILLQNPTNRGKAASLWLGLQRALDGGAIGVVTLDGDGQHAPKDIPRLLAEALRAPNALVIGVRRQDQRRASPWRYGANRVADFWISWAAGSPLEDSQSGFRVYPRSLLETVNIKHGRERSFVFESEILIEASRLGYGSLTVSIDVLRRQGARPSYFRPVLDIARITLMVAWKLISRGMYPIGLYRSLTGRSIGLFGRVGLEQPMHDSSPETESLSGLTPKQAGDPGSTLQ